MCHAGIVITFPAPAGPMIIAPNLLIATSDSGILIESKLCLFSESSCHGPLFGVVRRSKLDVPAKSPNAGDFLRRSTRCELGRDEKLRRQEISLVDQRQGLKGGDNVGYRQEQQRDDGESLTSKWRWGYCCCNFFFLVQRGLLAPAPATARQSCPASPLQRFEAGISRSRRLRLRCETSNARAQGGQGNWLGLREQVPILPLPASVVRSRQEPQLEAWPTGSVQPQRVSVPR